MSADQDYENYSQLHLEKAERCLVDAADNGAKGLPNTADRLVQVAAVHAQLAQVAATHRLAHRTSRGL